MKKWITKKEISEILQNYSIQKDEFEQFGNSEYCYQSKYVKGYVVTLKEEIQGEEKTGRIIVSHTNATGKKTFNDIWMRNKEGKIEFLYRNPWNVPCADIYYIKDLEQENEQLRQAGRKLQEQLREYQKLNNNIDTNYIKELEQQNKQLKIENEKLQNQMNNTSSAQKIHNERGAGRKPSKERLNAIEAVRKMLDDGHSEQEIMDQLKISRATFFRYKKCIKNFKN